MKHRFLFLTVMLLACLGLKSMGQIVRSEARLKPTDSVGVRITGVPADEIANVNGAYPISESGMVSMPYIGKVTAAGLTPSQLGSAIEQAYIQAKIYRKPNIVVTMGGGEKGEGFTRRITVGGEVRAPQLVAYRDGMNLFEAITAAGGPSDFGDMRRVRLIRNGKTTEYNLKRLTLTPEQNPALRPDDQILVPSR